MMTKIIIIARLLAAFLGTPDFHESWACWERGIAAPATDPIYVCVYGVENDPREARVMVTATGNLVIYVNWWPWDESYQG